MSVVHCKPILSQLNAASSRKQEDCCSGHKRFPAELAENLGRFPVKLRSFIYSETAPL